MERRLPHYKFTKSNSELWYGIPDVRIPSALVPDSQFGRAHAGTSPRARHNRTQTGSESVASAGLVQGWPEQGTDTAALIALSALANLRRRLSLLMTDGIEGIY